jgi:p-aminobenzoyl-glutamate transporter AbgT
MPAAVTVTGVVLITGVVNLFVGSASAKWALLAPILVPMLMALGISPDLTQAAYRVGDSSTNIITPLMPYFPLVVVFAQRYVTQTGIGTVVAMMLPYPRAASFTCADRPRDDGQPAPRAPTAPRPVFRTPLDSRRREFCASRADLPSVCCL